MESQVEAQMNDIMEIMKDVEENTKVKFRDVCDMFERVGIEMNEIDMEIMKNQGIANFEGQNYIDADIDICRFVDRVLESESSICKGIKNKAASKIQSFFREHILNFQKRKLTDRIINEIFGGFSSNDDDSDASEGQVVSNEND